jgi:16S rRNA (cytosine1402-N4)-methyltransferase
MLDEVISFLDVVPDGIYVDMTAGDGGHSLSIIQRLSQNGRLIAFDKDMDAIEITRKRLKEVGDKNFTLINEDFSCAKESLKDLGIKEVDGFIFDLGVSSRQLDEAKRGFSFSKDARLDMRMDLRNKVDAHKLVNELSFEDLYRIIKDYGEERFAKRIARSIVQCRADGEISTTRQLADLVSGSIPKKFQPKKIHPATKTFQALRIEVNKELASLEKGVKDAAGLIKKGGRVCVISFNSLEDRIVKRIFKEGSKGCICPKEVMYCQCGREPYLKLITKKPGTPSELEIKGNPRARSAKLRAAEKI